MFQFKFICKQIDFIIFIENKTFTILFTKILKFNSILLVKMIYFYFLFDLRKMFIKKKRKLFIFGLKRAHLSGALPFYLSFDGVGHKKSVDFSL